MYALFNKCLYLLDNFIFTDIRNSKHFYIELILLVKF